MTMQKRDNEREYNCCNKTSFFALWFFYTVASVAWVSVCIFICIIPDSDVY